jgi:EAL domain-containing protein (putative c-di-GMP-specific phosphodiesterase class I)/cellobiose-specific phosphotransferase system component IIC
VRKFFIFCKEGAGSQVVSCIVNSRLFNAIASSTMAMVPLFVACGMLELISSVSLIAGFENIYSWLSLLKEGLVKIAPIMLNIFLSMHFARRNRIPPMSLALINLGVLIIVSSFFSESPYFFLDVNISASMLLGVTTGIVCEKTINYIHDRKHERFFAWYLFCGAALAFILLYLCGSLIKLWKGDLYFIVSGVARSLYPSDYFHGLIYLLFCGASWFFGLNGENLLETQLHSLVLSTNNNIAAWHAGHATLNVISSMFFNVWCNIGGSGSTLSLAAAMLFSDKKYYRKLLSVSAPLSIFNTNDTLLFGVPIVLNPIMIIPFILVPMMNYTVAYVATIVGLIPPLQSQFSWVTPPLMNAWLASGGSVRMVVLQIVVIAIGAKIYHAFLKVMESRINFNDKILQDLNVSLLSQNEVINHPAEFNSVRSNNYLTEMNDHFIAQDKINNLRKSGDFILYFQPQVKLPENEIIGCEALIRHKAKDGKITPPVFLEYYERLNLMPEIDFWVLQTVVNIIRTQLSGFKGYTMCINMSPQTLSDNRLHSIIKKCLSEPLPNGWVLEFEITESQKISDPKMLSKCLSEIKALGVKISLDDFGSGYSTISYINEYDLDKIKLDRSLVQNLNKDNGFCFLKNVVTLCQGTNAIVLIEGVETEEERQKVFSAGVSYAQGFLFHRPLPLEALCNVLDQKRTI